MPTICFKTQTLQSSAIVYYGFSANRYIRSIGLLLLD